MAPIAGESVEGEIVANLAALPIDRRYGISEMENIVHEVEGWLSS